MNRPHFLPHQGGNQGSAATLGEGREAQLSAYIELVLEAHIEAKKKAKRR
jgi:hypothetical protein